MRSIVDCLEHGAAVHPDTLLYSFLDVSGRERDRATYFEFHDRTRRLAQHLSRNEHLLRGDRVLLVYPPGLELITAFFACARIGVIPVPVSPKTAMNVAGDCQATGALTTRGLKSATPPLPGVRWIATDGDRGAARDGFGNDPHPVLFLQYTSGSTSAPKGVVVSHDNVLHNGASVLDFVPRLVSWLPQHHDMGLIGYYLNPVISGGTLYGFSPLDFLKRPVLWLETISRVRASHTASPNFGYEYCLREDKVATSALAGLDLSCLRVMMNASEPVRPRTQERFFERFAPFGLRKEALIAAYGLAENTLAVTQHGRRAVAVNKQQLQKRVLRLEPHRAKNNNQVRLMSCGRPLDGVEVAVVHPETKATLREGRIGEIWTAGASTCEGYWNRAGAESETFGAVRADDPAQEPRYLRTGDLGFLHEGELFVCGRIKDMIIIRGENYYPQDIEAIVESASDKIRPGATAAFDAGDDGEQLVVAVGVNSARDLPELAALARAIRAQYYVEPATIVLVPHGAIPKTTSGKLSRSAARQRFLDGTFPILASRNRERNRIVPDAATGLRQRFRYVLDLYDLRGDEDDPFATIGLDSLTMVELLTDIKRLLDAHGAGEFADDVDVRLLSRLTIAEFFGLLDRLENAPGESLDSLREHLLRVSSEQVSHEAACMRKDATLAPWLPGEFSDQTAPLTDVLLTGVTGFFGPFLLASLLRETPHTFHALTRAEDAAHGMDRIRAALSRSGLLTPQLEATLHRRVRVVAADLTRPNLGLDENRFAALAAQTQAVLHSGALVNYVQSYDELRPHNVDGTRELLRFAATGVRKEFHFVSSTFIHGWTAKERLLESDDNDAMDNLDFGYAQSKWVAEQLVFAAGRSGLTVRVYRPSLMSASFGGVGSRDDIAVRLLAFMIRHGVAVDAENQISFLPVDIAAHNVATLVARADLAATTFHVTVDDYYNMADVTREITRAHGYEFVYRSIPEFVAEMNRRATKDDSVYPLLNFFNRSHPKISAMARKRYDNRNYREARDGSGRGRADATLSATVDYLMAFLFREELIPSYSGEARYGRKTTA